MPKYYRSSRSSYSRSSAPQRNNRAKAGQYIDPSRFVKAATAAEAEIYMPQHSFADFELNQLLKANLEAKGYTVPSPIQDQAIPAALAGRDVIGIANTGTGKTAVFALAILQSLITQPGAALIIAPTRELAQQIIEEFQALGKGSGIFGTLLIGGVGMGNQLRDLRQGPRVVVGTPGRIKDHINRRSLNLSRFNLVVLDEVDRMLDMGFIKDVTQILSQVNSNRQSFFFSATMDPKIRQLVDAFASDPVVVSLKAGTTSENIHQNVVRYQDKSDKINKLHDLLIDQDVEKAIVFDETQRSVERLNKELLGRGFAVEAIHGGKSQGQRQRALARFKDNQVKILVATDVAARGIDVIDVTHVINFSLPKAYDDYVHRIGRAGRAGKIGHALTFVAH